MFWKGAKDDTNQRRNEQMNDELTAEGFAASLGITPEEMPAFKAAWQQGYDCFKEGAGSTAMFTPDVRSVSGGNTEQRDRLADSMPNDNLGAAVHHGYIAAMVGCVTTGEPKMMPKKVYGFSTPQSEIETMLGLKPGDLMRLAYDMDLAHDCRFLAESGIDLKDEAAVRAGYAEQTKLGTWRDYPPRWIDAVVLVAKGYSETAYGADA
jgi:hypothetical protein